jgi:hypothetical protein
MRWLVGGLISLLVASTVDSAGYKSAAQTPTKEKCIHPLVNEAKASLQYAYKAQPATQS